MNKPLQQTLWENIRNFTPDDPASDFPFSKKLQQENNWSKGFATSAIEEYKRFIFLCCILPNGASPSDTVDKVWHLHLTYTANYWIEFCKNTLHKDIHHFPSLGGSEEKTKHVAWYQQTLQQYKEVFGTEPPLSIWPASAAAKAPAIDIYDKSFFNKAVLAFALGTILFITVFNLFHQKGPDFLVYYFILMTAGIIVSWILQKHKSKKLEQYLDEHFPKQFSPYQIAQFLYGPHRAYQTALIDLIKRDVIETSGNAYKVNEAPFYDAQKEANPLLPGINNEVPVTGSFTYGQGFTMINHSVLSHPEFEQFNRLSKQVDYQKLIIPGIVLVIGIARLFQGLANEKPVTYLVFEIGLFSLIALMIAAQYSYTYLVFKKAEQTWRQQNNDGRGANILNNFTLLGVTAVAGFAEYNLLASTFNKEAPERKRRGMDMPVAVAAVEAMAVEVMVAADAVADVEVAAGVIDIISAAHPAFAETMESYLNYDAFLFRS